MLAVAGIGAQSGSLLLGPILALFVYAVFNNVIDEEERLLRKVFGQDYIDYCARVPRFGPKFSTWKRQEQLLISVSGLGRRIRDAAPYLLALPLFELIAWGQAQRSEEHTSEPQSLMRISYAVFCLNRQSNPLYATSQQ